MLVFTYSFAPESRTQYSQTSVWASDTCSDRGWGETGQGNSYEYKKGNSRYVVVLGNVEMRSYAENKFTFENKLFWSEKQHVAQLGDNTQGDGAAAGVSGKWPWLAEGWDLGAAVAPHAGGDAKEARRRLALLVSLLLCTSFSAISFVMVWVCPMASSQLLLLTFDFDVSENSIVSLWSHLCGHWA